MARNFSSRSVVDDTFPMQQPTAGTLHVDVSNSIGVTNSRRHAWFDDWDDEDSPFRYINEDSLWLNTVKVSVERSPDSLFHIYETRVSRGRSSQQARELASHIPFQIEQWDSLIVLPRGFTISKDDKFRNQQVLVTIEVPVGKKLKLDRDINDYEWFDIQVGRKRYNVHHGHHRRYYGNRDYIMTPDGLEADRDITIDSGKQDTVRGIEI
jgi:hypothetical protein